MKANRIVGALLVALIAVVGFYSKTVAIEFGSGTLKISQITLENGLTVILNEDHSQPEVFGIIMVKAGGKNDPADATGMAHYQEHMLFKGTTQLGTIDWEKEKPHIDRIFELYDELGKTKDEAKRKEIQTLINDESLKAADYAIPNELSNLITEMGGTNLNAGTGPDYTVYYNKFPSNQIERWIDLYAHRFTEPVFRSFQAELEVVYEEKNLYNDQFQTKLLEEFQRHFFKQHPYGQQTLIGSIEDLKNPSLTKMYEFFRTYYVPNNMALVLSGDFKSEEIIPIIEAKFGVWQSRDLPETPKWSESPFNGREFQQAKITPIKIAILGYRAPSQTDKKFEVSEIVARLLNNSYSTGLLDKLSIDGKLLAAQAIPMPYHDHGAVIILAIPKIVGQSLENAESIILAELDKLKRGDFDDWMLDAIKQDMYRQHTTSMESIQSRALYLGYAFAKGQPVEEALDYSSRLMSITKEDVVALANEIFGPNFLAFYSKMGFPKKEKIQKPDYKPLLANPNARSVYAQHFDTLPTFEPRLQPIDFENDIDRTRLSKGHEILRVNNPLNDVFSFTIAFEVGEYALPMLRYSTQGINMSGAAQYNVNQLKEEFAKAGASYNVFSNDSYTIVDVQGIESNLRRTLELVGLLLNDPKLDQSKIKTIIDGDLTNRKMERSEPDQVAQALLEYGLFGSKSEYIDRLTAKQLKKLQADELIKIFKEAATYSSQVRFTGKTDIETLTKMVEQYIPLAQNHIQGNSPVDKQAKQYTQNTILLVNKPKARQSKVFLFFNGEPFSVDNAVPLEAFNRYFGGGFSGLVVQEIREYRSLAYSTGASFQMPAKKGSPSNFIGYVGTQADKTLIAMETFNGLIREMPQKPERISMIRNYLELSAQTSRPNRRGIASTVERWKHLGYDKDPMVVKLPAYRELEWETIMDYYSKNMKEKPVVYMIVGDKKQINLSELAKYGDIVEIKEGDLFSK